MSCLSLIAVLIPLFAVCFAGPAIVYPAGFGNAPVVPSTQLPIKPYEFGYEFGDGLGMSQHRKEVSDGTGIVKGSYGYMDPAGAVRIVEYTADADGYRAVVRTNERGIGFQNPANVLFVVQK